MHFGNGTRNKRSDFNCHTHTQSEALALLLHIYNLAWNRTEQ